MYLLPVYSGPIIHRVVKNPSPLGQCIGRMALIKTFLQNKTIIKKKMILPKITTSKHFYINMVKNYKFVTVITH